jgi:N-acetylglucosaminyldiphosphoundecaprenol N-acetyl-beta-D-mannosaminyltransferase
MPELCALAAIREYPVFLFGARPGVAEAAAAALRERYPTLRVAGCRDGYVKPAEQDALIDEINVSGARLLFVALGSPAQEIWIHANLSRLTRVSVCQGVGGTFDVLAGRVRRAPVAWRKAYLEWFYRLMREPARIRRMPRLMNFAWRVWREGVQLTTIKSG